MAYLYDTNALRQIDANDSEFNKAQKADNLHNMQTNIALNGYTGNINLANRPVVQNPDGSVSTVRSMSFNEDGKEILIPTVSQNGTIMNPQQAIDEYHRTGQHLGVFNSPEEANAMAQQIHNQQEQMYGNSAPNPANDPAWYLKVNNMPVKASQAAVQGNNTLFRAQDVSNIAIRNLMKKGYSQDEAEQMLAPYISEWQDREANERRQRADELIAGMNNIPYGTQEYYNAAMQIYQTDPQRGELLLRGAVTPKEMWARQNRLDDLADQRAYQEQMRAMYGGGRGAGRPRGSGGGGSGGGGGRGRRAASDSNLKAMLSRQKYIEAEMGKIEKLGDAASPQDRERHRKLYDAHRLINSQLDSYYLGTPYEGGEGVLGSATGMTKEQMANGIQNVIWDDGLKAGGPSDDAIDYLMSKLPGATPEKIKAASNALYNSAGAAEDADAALLGNDVPLQARQNMYGEGMNEASRLGYKVDLDGTIYGASEEFKNKYPNLKYAPGADYYKGLLAQSLDYDEDDENA